MESSIENLDRHNPYFQILKAQIGISRLGEKDIYNWWDVEAQSEGGLYALKRLFKNTYYWAAMEISIRSAKAKIDGIIKSAKYNNPIHLFNLTPRIDAAVWELFYQFKKESTNLNDFVVQITNFENPFIDLSKHLSISEDSLTNIKSKSDFPLDSSVIILGIINVNKLNDLEKDSEILNSLIAYFSLGGKDKLIIPAYSINQ